MRAAILTALAVPMLWGCNKGSSPEPSTGEHQELAPTPVGIAPADTLSQVAELDPAGASYVIVYAEGLGAAAKAWADYRSSTGERVTVLEFAAIGGPSRSIDRSRGAILEAFGARRADGTAYLPGKRLLLLGDAPAAQETQLAGTLPTQLATDLFGAIGEPAAGDNLWASVPPRLAPLFAVGRVPARSEAEALVVLDKVKRYEAAPDGDWQYALEYVAGEGRFGEDVDEAVEQMFVHEVEQTIPSVYTTHMTYASPKSSYAYPPLDLPAHIQHLFQSGALMITYVGHGQASSFDQMYVPTSDGSQTAIEVFGLDHARRLDTPHSRMPIALIMACSTGEFDWTEGRSLAEELLFAPGGPVAVVAGSRTTHPYANALYVKIFNQAVATSAVTLGDALDSSKRHLLRTDDPARTTLDTLTRIMIEDADLEAIAAAHVLLYNILGDPALVLRKPRPIPTESIAGIPSAVKHGASFEVTINNGTGDPGATPQSVTYTWTALPTSVPVRTRAADYDQLLMGSGEERAKVLETHRDANDRTVHGPVTVDVASWPVKLTVDVPAAAMPAGASYDLRVELRYAAKSAAAARLEVGGWRISVSTP